MFYDMTVAIIDVRFSLVLYFSHNFNLGILRNIVLNYIYLGRIGVDVFFRA